MGQKQPVRLKYADVVRIIAECDIGKTVKTLRVDEYLDTKSVSDESDRQFMTQTLFGIEQHEQLISKTVDLYLKHNSTALPTDAPAYRVLVYWLVFRLSELGMKQFIRLLKSQGGPKALLFLRFFTSKSSEGLLVETWGAFYDEEHVREKMVGELYDIAEGAASDIAALVQQVEGGGGGARSDKAPITTKQEPFAITKPKPRTIPEPEVLNQEFKSRPVPKHDGHKKIEQQLEKERAERKATKPRPPKLSEGTQRMSRTEKMRQELEEAPLAEFKSRPAPVPPKATVRLNAAAILREDALYQKRIKAEAEQLKQYEAELRDSSNYDRWKKEEKAKKDAEQAELVAQRKLESAAAMDDAKEARMLELLKRQTLVAEIQEEVAAELDELERLRAVENKKLQDKARKLQAEVKEGPRQQQAALMDDKRRLVEQLKTEAEELDAEVKAQREKERAEKEDLIRQIRAVERVPKASAGKDFDPATTAGLGLMDEMSLVELRRRLQLAKEVEADEEDRKRRGIVDRREAREQELIAKAGRVKQYRQAAHHAARADRASKVSSRASTASQMEVTRLKSASMAQQKLDAKREKRRAEAIKLAQMAQEKRDHARRLTKEARATKERWYADMAHNAEKTVAKLEKQRNAERATKQQEAEREAENQQKRVEAEREKKEAEAEAREAAFNEKKEEAAEAAKVEAAKKEANIAKVREIEGAAKETLERTQPYRARQTAEAKAERTAAKKG